MSKKTPCGKCTTCDCGPNGTCGTADKANTPPKSPTVNCECANNRVRKSATPTGPLADSYTCHKPKIVEAPVMETRCTCRHKNQTKVECECAPPQAVAVQPSQAVPVQASRANSFAPQPIAAQPENVHITCGHSGPNASRPYYQKTAASSGCSHCKTRSSGKKCVIQ